MSKTPPLFVLTFDGGDLCELALRLPTEREQDKALRDLEIVRLIRKRERENAQHKEP